MIGFVSSLCSGRGEVTLVIPDRNRPRAEIHLQSLLPHPETAGMEFLPGIFPEHYRDTSITCAGEENLRQGKVLCAL
jgi:hypothetical protein